MTDVESGFGNREAEGENWPPFLRAVHRLEPVLAGIATETEGTDEQVFAHIMGVSKICSELGGYAQTHDFVRTTESLKGTSSVDVTGQNLADAIREPKIPEGVRAIYKELYPDVLEKYPPPPVDGAPDEAL